MWGCVAVCVGGCGSLLESSSPTFHVTQPTGRVSQLMKPLFWSSLGGQFVLVISPMSLPSKTRVKGQLQCPFNIYLGSENPSPDPRAATL